MASKVPAYKRIPRLVTLYRRVALRWPSAKRTFSIYRELSRTVYDSGGAKRFRVHVQER